MALAALLMLSCAGNAETLTGTVVGITDGDTVTVRLSGERQVKIRLADLDAPEIGEPYGVKARQELSDLAFRKDARVEVQNTDRRGRLIGRVYVGALDVNAAMVERGAAWVYRQYSHDPKLLELEGQAKAARRGLWALPVADQTPPWEWRRVGQPVSAPRTPTGAADPQSLSSQGPTGGCGEKRKCGEMSNCGEARHYLNDCGVGALDRDKDGIPCESLCKK